MNSYATKVSKTATYDDNIQLQSLFGYCHIHPLLDKVIIINGDGTLTVQAV